MFPWCPHLVSIEGLYSFQSGLYGPVNCVLSKPGLLNQHGYHVILNSIVMLFPILSHCFCWSARCFSLHHSPIVCQAFILKKTTLGYCCIQTENPLRNRQGNSGVYVQVTPELRPVFSFVSFEKQLSRDKMTNQSCMKFMHSYLFLFCKTNKLFWQFLLFLNNSSLLQYKIKFRIGRAHAYEPTRLLCFGFKSTIWNPLIIQSVVRALLNFLLGTCENSYRVVGRRHRKAGSSLRKQKQMKCGHLVRAGFCIKLAVLQPLYCWLQLQPRQIVYTVLAVWDVVKYCSAALHLYRT